MADSASGANRQNLLGVLGIVFIVLKLTSNIGWSWWWVLTPFWVGPAVAMVVFVVAFIVALTARAFTSTNK